MCELLTSRVAVAVACVALISSRTEMPSLSTAASLSNGLDAGSGTVFGCSVGPASGSLAAPTGAAVPSGPACAGVPGCSVRAAADWAEASPDVDSSAMLPFSPLSRPSVAALGRDANALRTIHPPRHISTAPNNYSAAGARHTVRRGARYAPARYAPARYAPARHAP